MPVTDWLVETPCFIEGKMFFAATGSTKLAGFSFFPCLDRMIERMRVMDVRFRSASFQAASLLMLMGCLSGNNGPETGSLGGVVTLKGTPLRQGTVQLFSRDSAGGGSAEIAPDGTYHVDAIPVGTYQVQIRPITLTPDDVAKGITPSPVTASIPSNFQNYSTSNLEVTIRPGSNEFNPIMK